MKIGLLPCEIYHREFDAKLILAARLAQTHNFKVIIGYDKYFNGLIKHLPPAVLLEKSCSTIMWEGRIKPTKEKGGRAIVSDEEGFNDLSKEKEIIFTNRLDTHATKHIDMYCCWGEIDFKFWGRIPTLENKIKILGNCRSDLVNSIGKKLYANQSEALRQIYGDYILVSDNFCVERINNMNPIFNVSEDKRQEAEKKETELRQKNKENRDVFANLIDSAAERIPSIQFIIRPHPVADSKWWDCRFSKIRNVHVVYHLNVDPWIIGAKALVSMGCTTALQAAIAKTPIIEIEQVINETDKNKNTGLSHKFTNLKANTSEQLVEHIHKVIAGDKKQFFKDLDLLNRYWHECQTSSATNKYSEVINDFADKTDKNAQDDLYGVLNMVQKYYASNPLKIDQSKWSNPTIKTIKNKLDTISLILNEQQTRIQKISNCLFIVSKM